MSTIIGNRFWKEVNPNKVWIFINPFKSDNKFLIIKQDGCNFFKLICYKKDGEKQTIDTSSYFRVLMVKMFSKLLNACSMLYTLNNECSLDKPEEISFIENIFIGKPHHKI